MSDIPDDIQLQSALDKIEYYRLEFEGVDRAKRDLQDVLGAFEPRWKYIRLAALRLIEERDACKALCDEMATALESSRTAIEDWLNLYASDECKPERVAEAKARTGEHGTLAYIASVQKLNLAALAAYRKDKEVGNG